MVTETVITKFQHQNPCDYGRSKLTSTSAQWHAKPQAANASHPTPPLNEYSKTIKQKEQKQRKGNKVCWGNLGHPALPVELQGERVLGGRLGGSTAGPMTT